MVTAYFSCMFQRAKLVLFNGFTLKTGY